MNLKNKFNFFAILCLMLAGGLFSCNDDDDNPLEPSYATLNDVILTQTVNGGKSFNLIDKNENLIYSTEMNIGAKPINWLNPVFEQTFNALEDIQEDKIVVTDAKGNLVESLDIKINDRTIKIVFLKEDNAFSYMSGEKFKLNIVTKLKESITNEELESLKDFSTQSVFYLEANKSQQVKSNQVTVLTVFDIYKEKGDPRNSEYKYQLNVVYFIPSDIKANPQYQERISKILFEHQLFVRKWMKHWGYEEKSYGLPLNEKGMVNIIEIIGKEPKAGYPYDGSAPKMIDEVKEFFKANNIEFKSDHTLILTAVNEDLAGGVGVPLTPFYGYGKWCFALDYPGMSQEAMGLSTPASHVATVWIGGMLHELGHGLNLPHVGPTYSHKNDSSFGITLMGAGNRTYGESPTFFHEASAAITNNCQVSSFVEKKFYDNVEGSAKITSVDINGNQCNVKGNFVSPINATDVIVRFFNSTEIHEGGAHGYTSVAFVTKPNNSDKTFEITIPIDELKVNKFDYKIGVTVLLENGTTKKNANEIVYYQKDNTLLSTNLDNSKWTATASHALPKDAVDNNSTKNLIDGDASTILALVKPDKSYGGVTVKKDEQVYVIINMAEQVSFQKISLSFSRANSLDWLRANKVSFLGSNDGVNFEIIKENNKLDVSKTTEVIDLGKVVKWQYLKMTYDGWHESGSTFQFSELMLENKR